MTENLSTEQILNWYEVAGVNAVVAETPFGIALAEQKEVAAKVDKAMPRQAVTQLSQVVGTAVESANTLCLRAQNLAELRSFVEKFEGCALKLTANKTVFGDGNEQAKVVFIGEAPGADEDREGRPFVGRSGKLLDKALKCIGLDRTNCYITNIISWRPPGNRTPTDAEMSVCLPFVKKQIDIIAPDYIFMLGGVALNAFLGRAEAISKVRGKWFDYITQNGKTVKVTASFHPAYLLRNVGQKAKFWADLLRLEKEMKSKEQ